MPRRSTHRAVTAPMYSTGVIIVPLKRNKTIRKRRITKILATLSLILFVKDCQVLRYEIN